ncbi:hypothetical protein LZD49_34975 [Dyadobacter sp. CY261]|uniref:hypothetical protein n=1 Tax=Dyadobacter sp. CY261 TaxID=2907203 RepID=UPI001F160C22|nr:hypothetical protein [Dyadobacter sp. CY261]MCF0075727.1 hypothetical protein [Dyadobacter sp. CY261]
MGKTIIDDVQQLQNKLWRLTPHGTPNDLISANKIRRVIKSSPMKKGPPQISEAVYCFKRLAWSNNELEGFAGMARHDLQEPLQKYIQLANC